MRDGHINVNVAKSERIWWHLNNQSVAGSRWQKWNIIRQYLIHSAISLITNSNHTNTNKNGSQHQSSWSTASTMLVFSSPPHYTCQHHALSDTTAHATSTDLGDTVFKVSAVSRHSLARYHHTMQHIWKGKQQTIAPNVIYCDLIGAAVTMYRAACVRCADRLMLDV